MSPHELEPGMIRAEVDAHTLFEGRREARRQGVPFASWLQRAIWDAIRRGQDARREEAVRRAREAAERRGSK